jgi:hypothetical protein
MTLETASGLIQELAGDTCPMCHKYRPLPRVITRRFGQSEPHPFIYICNECGDRLNELLENQSQTPKPQSP